MPLGAFAAVLSPARDPLCPPCGTAAPAGGEAAERAQGRRSRPWLRTESHHRPPPGSVVLCRV